MDAAPVDVSACTTCTAVTRWVITLGGKRVRLDPDPHPAGTVVLTLDGGRVRGRVLTGADLPAQQAAYRRHDCTRTAPAPRCIAEGCRGRLDPVLAGRGGWYSRWHPCCAPILAPRPAATPPAPEQQELTP